MRNNESKVNTAHSTTSLILILTWVYSCWGGRRYVFYRGLSFFFSFLSRLFRLICPTRSTNPCSSSFGFPVVTSTGSNPSGIIFCAFNCFIFLTLSMVSGNCLLLSGRTYHIRFLNISFLISNAFPLATCRLSALSGKPCKASK